MIISSILALLSLSAATLASTCSQHHRSTINYTTISGFFLQDEPTTDPSTFDYTTVNYGLLDRSYITDKEFDPNSKKTQWQRFEHYVDTLNRKAEKNTQYKVLFMARHGEGYHNAAESYYGTPAWNCYWGPLDGNGTIIWKDARLTPTGLAQCTKANNFWRQALIISKIPAPQIYYSSPLTRSVTTANLTFADLGLPSSRPFAPIVKEFLREGISIRSCDERSSKSAITALLPEYRFEDGFTEDDMLWRGHDGEGETGDAQEIRAKAALDDIFARDESTWISITTHSGQIRTALKVLGHREFGLSTGQAIPVLVKARKVAAPPATTIESFTAESTCTAPPATSVAGQGCVCSRAAEATPTPA
ncbi:phosphoglycerate mutase-like protein [Xylaria bambusicola]|uniref:phosphoglycerate mutase-like protein n=1 Tax=Xylaria bambusicola TaxID=326684 RepID=UPI002007E053|nr:phosphoglycerate mutase-like protein [Xylaria bambusicola]KAI0503421.1 phosphoglycerate mutase-like protein [Xylaria bambusicola]